MEILDYDVRINASKPSVWSTLTETEKYTKWVKAFSPNSYADGEWKQGTYIKFLDPDMGGTKALIEALETNEHILVRHISMISKEGEESTDGEMASHWIGTTEEYRLIEDNNATSLKIQIKTHRAPLFIDFLENPVSNKTVIQSLVWKFTLKSDPNPLLLSVLDLRIPA